MSRQRRERRDMETEEFHEARSHPPHMLQMTAELVANFSGEDEAYSIEKWIDEVESNAEIFEWSPLQKLLIARRSLTGTAALWLKTERPYKSWDDLKAALIKEFPDQLDAKAIHEIMSARRKRQHESCINYMFIMKELGQRGKMEDKVAIKYIIDGILDKEVNKMILYGVSTYKELKERLKIYETVSSKMKEAKRNKNFTSVRRKRCYNCGKMGHVSLQCPHKVKGLKCFKCNAFGHISFTCNRNEYGSAVSVCNRTSSGNSDNRMTKHAMFTASQGDAITVLNCPSTLNGKLENRNDILAKTHAVNNLKKKNSDEYKSGMSVIREVIPVKVNKRIISQKPMIKRTFNKIKKTRSLKRMEIGTGHKVKPNCVGPYEIIKLKDSDRYEVQNIDANIYGPVVVASTAAGQMKNWPVQNR